MIVLGICLSVIMILLTPGAVTLLMGDVSDGLAENAEAYVRIIAVFYVLCFLGNSFVGLYRGLGMVHVPVLGTVLHISVRVIGSYLLIGKMGLGAVAVSTGIGWAAVVTFQAVLYKKKVRAEIKNIL